jgi:osmotically-inducible protein OsmY
MKRQPETAEQVANLVREALRQDMRFRTSSIEVSMARGAVVLTGLVPDPSIRAAAIAVAQRTRGVTEVVDRIRVQPFTPRFDADITADVVSAITLNANVNPARIDVQTVDGVVYLRGTVPDATSRQMVDSIARSVDGVRDVVDDLGIEPPVAHPDSEIARMLRDRLGRVFQPEAASRIRLAVRHGVVYLRGEVDTTSLRWALEDLVRWTPGVVDVVDEMQGPTV